MIADAFEGMPDNDVTKTNLSPRILEMRKKINDKRYLDSAIRWIAQVISNMLIEDGGQTFL